MRALTAWAPSLVMGLAAVFTIGIDTQRSMPLRAPLQTVIPLELDGFSGRDLIISDDELRVAGVTDYLMRSYESKDEPGKGGSFSLYVGYYDRQMRGKTIHSPKNCLPGAGWEALASREVAISTAQGQVIVNRYLLQRGDQRALVLYWYQGRGRVQANEYLVKWDLLRDSALRQRSDEALVRIVVPITNGEERALETAVATASRVVPSLATALPQ